jgi:hypothetical protein
MSLKFALPSITANLAMIANRFNPTCGTHMSTSRSMFEKRHWSWKISTRPLAAGHGISTAPVAQNCPATNHDKPCNDTEPYQPNMWNTHANVQVNVWKAALVNKNIGTAFGRKARHGISTAPVAQDCPATTNHNKPCNNTEPYQPNMQRPSQCLKSGTGQ